jgi:hypothetical protein
MASGDPVPTPNPYLDPDNAAFEAQLAKATGGKDITSFSLQQARELFEEANSPQPPHFDISVQHFEVETTRGRVRTFLYRPKHVPAHEQLPFIYHIHGGAWFIGNAFVFSGFLFELVVSRASCYRTVIQCSQESEYSRHFRDAPDSQLSSQNIHWLLKSNFQSNKNSVLTFYSGCRSMRRAKDYSPTRSPSRETAQGGMSMSGQTSSR